MEESSKQLWAQLKTKKRFAAQTFGWMLFDGCVLMDESSEDVFRNTGGLHGQTHNGLWVVCLLHGKVLFHHQQPGHHCIIWWQQEKSPHKKMTTLNATILSMQFWKLQEFSKSLSPNQSPCKWEMGGADFLPKVKPGHFVSWNVCYFFQWVGGVHGVAGITIHSEISERWGPSRLTNKTPSCRTRTNCAKMNHCARSQMCQDLPLSGQTATISQMLDGVICAVLHWQLGGENWWHARFLGHRRADLNFLISTQFSESFYTWRWFIPPSATIFDAPTADCL